MIPEEIYGSTCSKKDVKREIYKMASAGPASGWTFHCTYPGQLDLIQGHQAAFTYSNSSSLLHVKPWTYIATRGRKFKFKLFITYWSVAMLHHVCLPYCWAQRQKLSQGQSDKLIGPWEIWKKFESSFQWLMAEVPLVKLPFDEYHGTLLMISQYWIR